MVNPLPQERSETLKGNDALTSAIIFRSLKEE